MTSENKLYISLGLITIVLIVGGVFFLSKQQESQIQREKSPMLGEAMESEGANHVAKGTKVEYSSNPPHSGPHYDKTAGAGIYDKAIEDGHLIHSLEHGAVILWYDDKMSKTDIEGLKKIFDKMTGKTIMTPRAGMGVPVALTSWTRILKLEKVDEKAILDFYEANYNRAPENAPI